MKIQVDNASYLFSGWNTQPDGNGATYSSSFTIGTGNVVLYAKWIPYAVGDTGSAGGKIFYDAGSYQSDPVNSSYGSWRYLEAPPADLGTCTWGVSGDAMYFASVLLTSIDIYRKPLISHRRKILHRNMHTLPPQLSRNTLSLL